MNISESFFIVSAAREAIGKAETIARTDMLLEQLRARGYGAALCGGRYDGVDKPNIIVVDPEPSGDVCLELVMRLARAYSQGFVLSVDASSAAQLLFTDGRDPVDMGKFTSVPKAIAERTEAYTERLGWYYICVPAGK